MAKFARTDGLDAIARLVALLPKGEEQATSTAPISPRTNARCANEGPELSTLGNLEGTRAQWAESAPAGTG